MSSIVLSPVTPAGERMAGHALRLVAPLWLPSKRRGLEPLPWLNSNSDKGLHRQTRAKIAAEWRRTGYELGEAALHAGLPRMDRAEIWAYLWRRDTTTRRRYDPANWYPTAKPVVDGLVDAGVLPGDDRWHVRGPYLDHGGTLPPLLGAGVGELVLHLLPWTGVALWPHAP